LKGFSAASRLFSRHPARYRLPSRSPPRSTGLAWPGMRGRGLGRRVGQQGASRAMPRSAARPLPTVGTRSSLRHRAPCFRPSSVLPNHASV
jgi:hypothetical protein